MNKLYTAKVLGGNVKRSIHTLQRWRIQGEGPPYIKLQNGGVLYDEKDVEEWLDSLKVSSTSESSVKQAQIKQAQIKQAQIKQAQSELHTSDGEQHHIISSDLSTASRSESGVQQAQNQIHLDRSDD
jgi:hypothetical protein